MYNIKKERKMTGKGNLEKAYLRFSGLLENTMSQKDISSQFQFFMSGKVFKQKAKQKGFVPIKIPKLTSKFIRTGRLA